MLDSELRAIYANAPVEKSDLTIVSITAPWFSRDYHLQNSVVDGVTITLEDSTEVLAEWAPMEDQRESNEGDLNYTRKIGLQQVNDLIANELDNWDPSYEKPLVSVRGYVIYSDGSVSSIKYGPVVSRVKSIDMSDEDMASIVATTTPVNNSATGERATITRIPMQRGFL